LLPTRAARLSHAPAYYTYLMDTLKRILLLILVALTVATVYNGIFYLFYKFWRH
jgi:hypothetical protein